MDLQPSELIATYNTTPGTVVHLRNHIFVLVDAQKGAHQRIHAKTGRPLSHEDTTNLPEILFAPQDTNTDKENNND